MNRTVIPIKGMHCKSCELLIEEELREIKQVKKADARYKEACAIIHYDGNSLNMVEVETAIGRAGYTIGMNEKKPWISTNFDDYADIIYVLFGLGAVYFLIKVLDLDFSFAGIGSNPSSLIAIFVIGLTAGLSTCMALVGGLVLSISAKFAQKHPRLSTVKKFRPHLAFNIGRVIGYFIFGGLIGALGSVVALSSGVVGLMTVAVGLLMIIFGLQLTGISPRLADFSLTLPSGVAKTLGISNHKKDGEYSDFSSAIMGGLTFFLPCGFTQSMQLLAMTSGSFLKGALIMSVFALGTMPGLLGVGGLTAIMKGQMASKFYKLAGVLVLLFAAYNIQNGATLAGIMTGKGFAAKATNEIAKTKDIKNQAAKPADSEGLEPVVFQASYNLDDGLVPSTFTAKAGQPVKLVVKPTESGFGCMSTIMVPRLFNKPLFLEAGKTLELEFTPQKPGRYPITCAMGVPHGTLQVN